jgi:hypothetical protein
VGTSSILAVPWRFPLSRPKRRNIFEYGVVLILTKSIMGLASHLSSRGAALNETNGEYIYDVGHLKSIGGFGNAHERAHEANSASSKSAMGEVLEWRCAGWCVLGVVTLGSRSLFCYGKLGRLGMYWRLR